MSNEIRSFDDKLRQALRRGMWDGDPGDPDVFWRRFVARRAADDAVGVGSHRVENLVRRPVSGFGRPTRAWGWGGAAMLGVLVCAIASILTFRSPSAPTSREQARTYRTAARQAATITLSDGTRAMLAPSTTMRVQYGKHGTHVDVTGQAMFTVTHNDRAPFIAIIGRSEARVLGTTFFVRRYASEHVATVVVTDGRVAMRDRQSTAIHTASVLSAGMRGEITDSGTVRVGPDMALDDHSAWTRGRLVFHATPARDVAAELARVYGLELRLADSVMAAQPLTWTVSFLQLPAGEALDAFATLLNARVVSVKQGFLISSAGATVRRRPRLQPLVIQEPKHGR